MSLQQVLKNPGITALTKVDGTVLLVDPEDGESFDLSELTTFVEGPIAIINLQNGRLLIVNEEAQGGLNRHASLLAGFHILGNALVCRASQVV